MKKILVAVVFLGMLSGCATNSQTVLLAGATGVAVGVVIANEVNRQPVIVTSPPPVHRLQCYNRLIGYDQWNRVVYQQVCQ